MKTFCIETTIEFFSYVYNHHEKANVMDQDGKPCYHCKKPIPLIYPTRISKITGRPFVKVDRSNRVDVNLRHRTKGIEVVSYHIECWKALIF